MGATQERGYGIGAFTVLNGERQIVVKTVNGVFDWEKIEFEDHGVKKVPLGFSDYFLAAMFSNKVPGCEDIKSVSFTTIKDLLKWKPELPRAFGKPMLASVSKFMDHWEARLPRCTIYGHLPEVTTFQYGVQSIATNYQCCEDGCPEIGTEIRGFGQTSFAAPGQRATHNESRVVCKKHKQLDDYEEHERIGEAHKAVLEVQDLETEVENLRRKLELEREKRRHILEAIKKDLEAIKKDHPDQLEAMKKDHADQQDQLHRFYTEQQRGTEGRLHEQMDISAGLREDASIITETQQNYTSSDRILDDWKYPTLRRHIDRIRAEREALELAATQSDALTAASSDDLEHVLSLSALWTANSGVSD
jgi:hypothetical protein